MGFHADERECLVSSKTTENVKRILYILCGKKVSFEFKVHVYFIAKAIE